MKLIRSAIVAIVPAIGAIPALAASSDWHHAEGASLRIVTSDRPDADGKLRGALEIRLKPGWKTYWVDPGDAGVPPTLEIAGIGVDVAFPAPKRFDDGYAVWAGYDHPVALALTFDIDGRQMPSQMKADAFLGLCETICIPVQAKFSIDVAASNSDPRDDAAVAHAFATLPGPARTGFEARVEVADQKAMTIAADVPRGVDILDLFVASNGQPALGAPDRTGPSTFTIPVLRGNAHEAGPLTYTLVTSAGAVTGVLDPR